MKDFELSVIYARSKVDNFIQKRIEFGYKESTVNIDKKNIIRF